MAANGEPKSQAEARRERQAAALRENLRRRKAQQRGRVGKAASEAAVESSPCLSDNHDI